jgi:hypothetical protein
MLCSFDNTMRCVQCGYVAKNPRLLRECGRSRPASPVGRTRRQISFQSGGPGTELKALLKDWLGIEPASGCKCNSMATKMDALGPDWCESDAGMAEILGVMRDEHAKRWADGRTKLPWTDFGARQLVRLACRRARRT